MCCVTLRHKYSVWADPDTVRPACCFKPVGLDWKPQIKEIMSTLFLTTFCHCPVFNHIWQQKKQTVSRKRQLQMTQIELALKMRLCIKWINKQPCWPFSWEGQSGRCVHRAGRRSQMLTCATQTQIQPFIFNNSFSCFVVLLLCVRAVKQQYLHVEQKQMWTVFTKVKLALKRFEWGGQEPKEELNSSLCKLDSVQKLHWCSSKCPLDWWAYYIRPETKTNVLHRQSLIGCVFSTIQGHTVAKSTKPERLFHTFDPEAVKRLS